MIDFTVKLTDRNTVKDFIEEHHYSHSINGLRSSYCFAMYDGDKMIGAMIYGKFGMANTWKKYADHEDDVIELRKLVLIDDTPKNSESYFIGHTLRWLKKNTTIKKVVSFADPNFGHSGVIYRATNFDHVGMTSPGRVIIYNGKRYHDKVVRNKYKGELKPFAKKIKQALEDGEAHYEKQLPKHTYVKTLRK